MIFHSLTSPPCCNSPRKCTPLKYEKRQRAGFPIVTWIPSYGPFTKHRERIEKVKETGNLNCIYKKKLDKAYFDLDVSYSDSKYLVKRTISEKVLNWRAFEIAINRKYDRYQRGWASMVHQFFDKKIESGKKSNMNEALEEHKLH